MISRILLLLVAIMLSLSIISCTQQPKTPPSLPDGNVAQPDQQDQSMVTVQDNASLGLTASQDMKKFSSINELKKFLAEQSTQQSSNAGYGGARGGIMMEDSVAMAPSAAPGAMEGSFASSKAVTSASDFSTTNVQVKGVDEADFMKNDDRYIYMVSGSKLIIIDAYDAKNADIISEIDLYDKENDNNNNYYYQNPIAKEIFINDDKLVLFAETYKPSIYIRPYDIEPYPSSRAMTTVYIYDMSDRNNPKLEKEFDVTGNYFQSRMIGNIVYFVSNEYVGEISYINEPMIRSADITIKPAIYYFDNPDNNYYFNTISSIDLTNDRVIDSMSLMLGYSNTLMVSPENIYIAYQKSSYWGCWYCERYDKERFYDVVVPKLQGELKTKITSIIDKKLSPDDEWSEISPVLTGFYEKSSMNMEDISEEYKVMFEDIAAALEEYDVKKALEERKTVVHKIGINDGHLTYRAKGEVYGSLLNQFSLDEYNGNLRLATTVDIWQRQRMTYNNVYVLDANLKELGRIEGIAKDEQIYSTRFLGDRLYMVTYRRIDPFFVIDLSSPTNPKILGRLKIPGYSDYLHPYDANHIIGVGKEADEEGKIGGVKIAMFDVTDVENPMQIDKVEIGDQGSDSAALHDHKAFLFSKEKNLLVIPVTEVTEREMPSAASRPYYYRNNIWYGVYAFHVDSTGFKLIGKARHSSSWNDYFQWWNEATVRRSLYMDNNLYSVSNKYLVISDLNNGLEELNRLNLPFENNYYWGYY